MIERLVVKNQLSFKEVDVSFSDGLIAFTGSSGAGKSILMQSILSLFGQCDANANSVEAIVNEKINLEEFGLQSEDINIFKYIKSKSTRYFINTESISKKSMTKISSSFLNSFKLRDNEEFENKKLIVLLDALVSKKISSHVKDILEFEKEFFEYKKIKNRLNSIEEKETKLKELKEFALFEISKIDDIDPKIGEDIELMNFKRSLSKKEKIKESLEDASKIFNFEGAVNQFLKFIEKKSDFFNESMDELRATIEDERERLSTLDEKNIETILDRIEKISFLKSRYGSIEDVLEYNEKKKKELKEYEKISFEKTKLLSTCKEKSNLLKIKSTTLSQRREEFIEILNQKINSYLEMLYMPKVDIVISKTELYEKGFDSLHVELGRINIKKISSGEYNRLRLAFIATTSEYFLNVGGILVLDEIDANLSGKESMSVAKVLKILSKKYQIFAISHQPQLSSQADSHFLVTKDETGSKVKLLDKNERIVELARMVSGEEVSSEATIFAQKILNMT
ncbi:MAG: AAA family ATPase [Sulfurospirillum sp.]|nr:AAA family ATPase [Sulfurospirillum sp.]